MRKIAALFLSFLFLCTSAMAADEGRLRPYILGSSSAGAIADKLDSTRQALQANGFEIAGEYAPYQGAHILIVTSAEMSKQAAGSDFGGYGAAQRISLTEVDGQVQVSYTNPEWMANVYRMKADMKGVGSALSKALGNDQDFGSSGGRTLKNLREYHYMVFMPYFDDHLMLAEYGSHAEAVSAVEAGLAAGKGGVTQIFRVDVDGKDEVLFGVAMKEGEGADATVMGVTDQSALRHTAHLPYEMLVSGNRVYTLHGKFRIAQSFPDLTMSTFMKISGAPDAIEKVLKEVASAK
jgi:hypothetical protein